MVDERTPGAPDRAPPCPKALLDEVQRDCAHLAARRRRLLGAFLILALGGGAALVMAMHHRSPGIGTWPHRAAMLGFLGLGVGLCALAFGVTLPAGRRLRPLVVLGAAGALGVLFGVSQAFAGTAMPFLAGAMCLGTGLGVSVAVGGIALGIGGKALRRHAPTGLLVGVGAGLLALVPLHYACADCSSVHLLVWHGLVPPTAGLLVGLTWGWLRAGD